MQSTYEKAVFGAGCFWHIEEEFKKVKGTILTSVGFMGGNLKNPSYKDVCTGMTGHAEVVCIEYDPKIISYDELLEVFWNIHDPTTLNRQGPDVGTQYRSAIFFYNQDQEKKAKSSKEKLEKSNKYKNKIVTEIKPAQNFWKAEEYHQQYFEKQKKCGI